MDDPLTPSPFPLTIPITDRAAHLARVHLCVTIPLLALTLVPFSARLYVRIWPVWRVGWDDALIVAGFVRSPYFFFFLSPISAPPPHSSRITAASITALSPPRL